MICYFNVHSKADISQLNLQRGPKTKKRKLKSKHGYAQRYQKTVQGIRRVSPEREQVFKVFKVAVHTVQILLS